MPTIALSLQVQPSTDVLQRIVSICRKRKAEIIALTYADETVELSLCGERRAIRQIELWLAALVDVHQVEACADQRTLSDVAS